MAAPKFSRAMNRRIAFWGVLSPLCIFQIGGCFTEDVILGALADSFALVLATAAQGLLTGLVGG
jgi:hypothetical protein